MSIDETAHVAFLERYYSKVHGIYDLTRKYYLLGRDRLLREIGAQEPATVVEVGCGTGRNLSVLRRHVPQARFGGVEPCTSMRERAARTHPWIVLSDRTVGAADLEGLLGRAPDVIFLSYSLSMIPDRELALAKCRAAVAPHGSVYVLDFGDLSGLGAGASALFRRWLHSFHVHPERLDTLWTKAEQVSTGPFSYWKCGRFRPSVRSEQPEKEHATAGDAVQH